MPITIYVIENGVNDKKYVGQTCGPVDNRFRQHCTKNGCTAIYRAITKHGREQFSIRTLFVCPDDQAYADEMECCAIKVFGTTVPNGYNLQEGGSNGKHSIKTKEKMSATAMGHEVSIETRAKLASANIGNKHALGFKPSTETRAKMAAAQRGNKNQLGLKRSPETLIKMAAAQRDKKCSAATAAKISASLVNYHKNKKKKTTNDARTYI